MAQPDCYLKEYLNEIHRRYGVQVSEGRFSDILKDLGITHKKVRLYRFSVNNSLQKRRYNGTKSSVMPGYERLRGGAPNKLFFWTNLASIPALEPELTDGAREDALSLTQFSFGIVPTSASFLL
jgi:hypothetical protein